LEYLQTLQTDPGHSQEREYTKDLELLNQLIKHNAVKTYKEVEIEAPPFLTSALDRNERSASRAGHFGPQCALNRGARAGLDAVVKRRFSTLPGFTLRPSSP
jgi:hypothetical protein